MEVKIRAFLTSTLDAGDVKALIRTVTNVNVTAVRAPYLTNRLLSASAVHPPYASGAINWGSP
jgi:hypothetical protein